LPAVIAETSLPRDVETMAYDFFTPQPVKGKRCGAIAFNLSSVRILTESGAKFYYFRAVMHDHADDKCLDILKNVVNAMNENSTLLLDGIVVPNQDVVVCDADGSCYNGLILFDGKNGWSNGVSSWRKVDEGLSSPIRTPLS
jgi:hypothetical protein